MQNSTKFLLLVYASYQLGIATFLTNRHLLFCLLHQIQKALGCKNNPLAYDITAACSGFVLGLVSAACHIRGNIFSIFPLKKALFMDKD